MSKKKTAAPSGQTESQDTEQTVPPVVPAETQDTEEFVPPVIEEVEATPVLVPLSDAERSTLTAVTHRYAREHNCTTSSVSELFVNDPETLVSYSFKIQEQLQALAERLRSFPDVQTIRDLETGNLDIQSLDPETI